MHGMEDKMVSEIDGLEEVDGETASAQIHGDETEKMSGEELAILRSDAVDTDLSETSASEAAASEDEAVMGESKPPVEGEVVEGAAEGTALEGTESAEGVGAEKKNCKKEKRTSSSDSKRA